MNFGRAFITAVMAELLMRGDGGMLHHFAVLAIGGVLWWLNPDPLPDAIERGLDAYRRKHQR